MNDPQTLGIRAYLLTKSLEPLLTRDGVIKAMMEAPPLKPEKWKVQ